MKIRILTLLFINALLITSCSSDDLTIEDMTLSNAEKNAIVKLVETNLSITQKKQVTITSTKLNKTDDMYYLSMYHGDGVTNTLLKVENGNTLKYGKVSCTSDSCAHSGGCLPDPRGDRCTPCTRGTKDCSKTVTSGELVQ